MVKNYHTIILGGGPSGISAAILLQKAGLPVCVIDRATFPRDKTCAGLVTLKTYNRIRQGRILRERFYSPRVLDYFYRHIPGREKFLRFFCDHHISTDLYPTTYLGLIRLLWGYKRQ